MTTPVEKFWANVDVRGPDECWPWKRKTRNGGYGETRRHGSRDGRWYRAHRLAYEYANGEAPGDLLVRHDCDNPSCCNPRHLRLGTRVDNMRDMHERGRAAGKMSHDSRPKLSAEQVRAIRASTLPHTVMAREHGVSPRTILDVRKRVVYARVA